MVIVAVISVGGTVKRNLVATMVCLSTGAPDEIEC